MDNGVHVVPLETDLCALAHEFMCRDKLFCGIVEIGDRCLHVFVYHLSIITDGVVLAYIHVFVHG